MSEWNTNSGSQGVGSAILVLYNQYSDLPELGRRWLLGERQHTVPLARLSLNTDEHDCGRGRSGGVKILDSVA